MEWAPNIMLARQASLPTEHVSSTPHHSSLAA